MNIWLWLADLCGYLGMESAQLWLWTRAADVAYEDYQEPDGFYEDRPF